MNDGWYWCPEHNVWGKGEACWVGGCADVVRRGPAVDTFVFDVEPDLHTVSVGNEE